MKAKLIALLVPVFALGAAFQAEVHAQDVRQDLKGTVSDVLDTVLPPGKIPEEAKALMKEGALLAARISRGIRQLAEDNPEIRGLLDKYNGFRQQDRELKKQAWKRAATVSPEIAEMIRDYAGLVRELEPRERLRSKEFARSVMGISRGVKELGKENAEIGDLLNKRAKLRKKRHEFRKQQLWPKAAAVSPEIAAMLEKNEELMTELKRLMPKKEKGPRREQ